MNYIGIVVGHMADYIKSHIGMEWRGIPIKYYENKRYLETNNIVSLYKARPMATATAYLSQMFQWAVMYPMPVMSERWF